MRAIWKRVAISCTLRPLNLAEVRAYVAERLRSAGYRGAASLFSTQVLQEIVRLTEGVPRLINLLCDACLTNGYKARRPMIDLLTVEESASELGLREVQIELATEGNVAVSAHLTRRAKISRDA